MENERETHGNVLFLACSKLLPVHGTSGALLGGGEPPPSMEWIWRRMDRMGPCGAHRRGWASPHGRGTRKGIGSRVPGGGAAGKEGHGWGGVEGWQAALEGGMERGGG